MREVMEFAEGGVFGGFAVNFLLGKGKAIAFFGRMCYNNAVIIYNDDF